MNVSAGTDLQGSLDQAKRELESDAVTEEQLNLLEPISPEEMVEAREELGPEVGRLTMLRHAREKRRGRPPGARNKRTDDLARYLLQFGEDPLVGAMRLATTQPEILMEASRQEFVKYVTLGTGDLRRTEKHVWTAPTLSYGEAQALIMRARELISPYIHGKKPVQIDYTIRGVDVIEEAPRQITAQAAVDGDYVEVGSVEASE